MKKMNSTQFNSAGHVPLIREPRWPNVVAILAVAGLYYALPENLSPGPGWLVPLLVVLLSTSTLISYRMGAYNVARVVSYGALGLVTVAMLASLGLLVASLPERKETPAQLLVSAACLWLSNLLIFASWYWRLDAGGPYQRDLRGAHTDGAFLFPQMILDPELREQMGEQDWKPGFVDYLFLAFNTSTAFSPTDVPVLSRWAKGLMMIQAAISLATLAILAARAINIL
jgi:hypothetical protein